MFALACLHFQERECDFAVFEAGIGGRYDPVRLVGALVTCVTSVDYEHVELLGNSLELIVSDKSDACACRRHHRLWRELRGACGRICSNIIAIARSQRLFVRDEIGIGGESASASGQQFDFRFGGHDFRALEMSLLGALPVQQRRHRRHLVPALAGTHAARSGSLTKSKPPCDRASAKSRWPGRLEAIRQYPLTVVDVGHTPDGIRQSLASLKAIYGAEGWILVVGISFDKKADEIVGALAPSFDTIICTAAHHKGADARDHRRRGAQGQSASHRSRRRHRRGRLCYQPRARRVAGP